MRLLVFTQKVDKNDSVLGFFHDWIVEISKVAESVSVICLFKGEMDLPKNVTVYSLGKENGFSKFKILINLYRYVFLIKNTYDRVFVHMNQEYVVLLGWYWKIKGIPVYLWRNHPKGNFLTNLAVLFSKKVFCTSKSSFTAKFSKTVLMPVGIDTSLFKTDSNIIRKKYSICMAGRISPIKHVELALQAFSFLKSSGIQTSLDIVGGYLPKDLSYYQSLKNYVQKNNLSQNINFIDALPQTKLPEIYNSHEICLNFTESGSFDKSIVEATACGATPLVSNDSLEGVLPSQCLTSVEPRDIAKSIEKLLDPKERISIQKDLKTFVESHSLQSLIEKLFVEIN